MVKLTKKGYDAYPGLKDLEIQIINETKLQVRIKMRAKGKTWRKAWIDKNYLAKAKEKKKEE